MATITKVISAAGAGSFAVPAGVSVLTKVLLIAKGGSGSLISLGGGVYYPGGGGGGGECRWLDNVSVTPGASISYSLGAAGNDSWWDSSSVLLARYGRSASADSGGAGGGKTGGGGGPGVGGSGFAGGNGGGGPVGDGVNNVGEGGGGGGPGGPNGVGGNAGNGYYNGSTGDEGGGGGGGANGGGNGGSGSGSGDGLGGTNRLGGAGSNGAGHAGSRFGNPTGYQETIWTDTVSLATAGPTGGSGGGSGNTTSAVGYGAGAGGSIGTALGGPALLVIQYDDIANLSVASGSFALTASTVGLWNGGTASTAVAAGDFSLTGNDANLQLGGALVLSVSAGSFVMAGIDATLTPAGDAAMAAAVGSFVLSYPAANLVAGEPIMFVDPGVLVMTGNDVALINSFGGALAAAAGAFTITGNAAVLTPAGGSTLTVDAASFAIVGNDNFMNAYGPLATEAGAFTITYQDVLFSVSASPLVARKIDFHPCEFGFKSIDIRRVGSVIDGGTSLSGVQDSIERDGGGYWRADFTNGVALKRITGKSWRAITDSMDGGAARVVVRLCESRFQLKGSNALVPHSDNTPFSDGGEYVTEGTIATAGAAPLRATLLVISVQGPEVPIGGELFSIYHAHWGWRAYRIIAIDGGTAILIRPPLREAIGADTPLDFNNPRCQMRLAAATSNPTEIGRTTYCAISFVEDMRKPLTL